MRNDIEKIILSEGNIADIVEELGEQITNDYKNKDLLVICVLKGSFHFTSDLTRAIKIPCDVEFIQLSSYENDKSTEKIKLIKDFSCSLENRDVLVVEDIVDTGITLSYIVDIIKEKSPASIKVCTLIDKSKNRKTNIKVDYVGESIEDGFVVGYGLDYNEKYRNLSYIGILKNNIFNN